MKYAAAVSLIGTIITSPALSETVVLGFTSTVPVEGGLSDPFTPTGENAYTPGEEILTTVTIDTDVDESFGSRPEFRRFPSVQAVAVTRTTTDETFDAFFEFSRDVLIVNRAGQDTRAFFAADLDPMGDSFLDFTFQLQGSDQMGIDTPEEIVDAMIARPNSVLARSEYVLVNDFPFFGALQSDFQTIDFGGVLAHESRLTSISIDGEEISLAAVPIPAGGILLASAVAALSVRRRPTRA